MTDLAFFGIWMYCLGHYIILQSTNSQFIHPLS